MKQKKKLIDLDLLAWQLKHELALLNNRGFSKSALDKKRLVLINKYGTSYS